MKKLFTVLSVLLAGSLYAQEPVMQWTFDATHPADTVEGLYKTVPGVKGNGILLDGFTTRVVRKAEAVAKTGSEVTVDAWIALGNYPWNWCPVLTTEHVEMPSGYRLLVGPHGQVAMQVAVAEQWVSCTSKKEIMPLRQWMKVTGTYKAGEKLELYVNGELVNTTPLEGKASRTGADCILGMTADMEKPSDIHRSKGTLPQFFGLDGILDEVKVYDKALSASAIQGDFAQVNVPESGLKPRHLPVVKSTGEFKAYYTKLKYYPGWDNVWRVGDDPDIVVCFEKSPIKLVFWRGIRYGASWVSENENWMTDQSVEAWNEYGCFEHMQDRHCRFSHVRIIENTPGRIVVHWRYAPTSAYDTTWNVDEKTGWECWVDEYYYIYPDGSAIRKVSWTNGSLGQPRQFQETLALISPGQTFADLVEEEVTTVSDYEGRRGSQRILDNVDRAVKDPYKGYTIQRYNYRSENKPYICFEPGNEMELRNGRKSSYNRAQGCNHFPVGQARCDGRTTLMADRPSHATSFPISWPVLHRGEQRTYWCGLYGMSTMSMDEIQAFGRSWAYAPELAVSGNALSSKGYDRSERCYSLEKTNARPGTLQFTLKGTKDSPVINPAFYVKNWNGGDVEILVNGKKYKDATSGVYNKLEGKDLVFFLFINKTEDITVTVRPK